MNVLDVMQPQVICVHRTDTLATAISKMGDAGIRHLLVVNSDSQLVGILSDRDCRLALTSTFSDEDETLAHKIPVEYIMTSAPQVIGVQASLREAALIMLEHRINALPVVRDGNLAGIVTSTDLLESLFVVNDA
jgi:CBS domain-containing protein